jgi:tRNA(Ile)-lysidine synthase
VKTLAQSVVAYIRGNELLKPGHRTGIAVSGGLDSVALLRLALEFAAELGIVLAVVHFNHRLRGEESDGDETFTAGLAADHGLAFHCQSGEVRTHSSERHLSLEAAARELRYQYFQSLLQARTLDRIATAHTLDDQAETVILRLARGAGTRGLAGIYPQVAMESGAIVRPLLRTQRCELEAYLRSCDQIWREDSSNRDLSHARNRVRHGILPALERDLNPNVRESLAETADLARAEEEFWQQQVDRVLPRLWKPDHVLKISELSALPLALRRRVVRRAGESLGVTPELKHVRDILNVAAGGATSLELPNGWSVARAQDELRFRRRTMSAVSRYAYPLTVPGEVDVPEVGAVFETVLTPAGETVSNLEDCLDVSLLKKTLTVRNWRPGDRYWPAHSKSEKKIKELLQERRVTGDERRLWPVVASGDAVVWVRGFPIPSHLRLRDVKQGGLVIQERPL